MCITDAPTTDVSLTANGFSLQGTLYILLPPIKTGDPCIDFCMVYKGGAAEYDAEYTKRYDEDLTTLIFVCHSSSTLVNYLTHSYRLVCSPPSVSLPSSIRYIQASDPTQTSNPQPSLLILDQFTTPGETPVVLPIQEGPPSEIVTVTCLMFASLLISLSLATFVTMLGK